MAIGYSSKRKFTVWDVEQCSENCKTLNNHHHGKRKVTAERTEGDRRGSLFNPKMEADLIVWYLESASQVGGVNLWQALCPMKEV